MAAQKISLIPSELDLDLYAGDGVELVLGLTNGDGEALNVTGAVLAQIRANRADVSAAGEFAADLSSGADGTVILSLTGLQTSGLVSGGAEFNGVWDMQWTATGAEPVTVLQGKIKCSPDVTR